MEKDTKKTATCCSCEADFKNEVDELVDNVEGYSPEDHHKKQSEVKAAFAQDHKPAKSSK